MEHPHTGGQSCSSRWGNQTATISRFFPRTCWATPIASSPSPIPQSNCCPSLMAKESWRGIDADQNNPGRWVWFYLQENDRVLEWWREIPITHALPGWKLWWHSSPKNGLPASYSLQTAGCTIGMRWLMNCPALSRVTTLKGLPFPSRLQKSLGLLGDVGWRGSGISQGSPKMCCPFQDASRGTLQSGTGTLWGPHLCDSEQWSAWPWNTRCGSEGPCGICLWREKTVTNAQGGPTILCNHP